MILYCDYGSNSTSHALSWKPYSKFCMHTKKNCRLLFLATSRTGCLATAQQNSDRNVNYKDNSYNMYVCHEYKNTLLTKERIPNSAWGIMV